MNDYITMVAKLNPELLKNNASDSGYIQTLHANYSDILMISNNILKDVSNIKKKAGKDNKVNTELSKLINVLKNTKSDIDFQKKEKEMWFMMGIIQPQGYNSILNVLNDYNKKFENIIEKMEKII